jgi:sulfate/thiosulfate transport system ATP-binding protein
MEWEIPVSVKVEDVTKRFGQACAIRDLSLDMRPGELLALLGPSGSGKTTLLRILAGLDQPTSGRVTFDGEDALRLAVQERNVGLVFQNYALFRLMAVSKRDPAVLSYNPTSTRTRR